MSSQENVVYRSLRNTMAIKKASCQCWNHEANLVLLKEIRQPAGTAIRGFSADAGIDHFPVAQPFALEPVSQQLHPGSFGGHSIGRTEAVTYDEQRVLTGHCRQRQHGKHEKKN